MSSSPQSISTTLLANRELISLDRARFFLANRVRTRTPLGAFEFLAAKKARDEESYKKRINVALECLEIYRECFPEEYARSSSPLFSLQREHEFYRLVHSKLFPLSPSEGVDLVTFLEREPRAYLPYIPVMGFQEHCWAGGHFNFWEIELCFRLAQVLSWETGAEGRGWEALSLHYGIPHVVAPAPPLAVVGWDLFKNSCFVEDSPLKFLPLAFNMITYQTGNPWLDLPRIEGYVAYEWSMKGVAQLGVMRQNADTMNVAIRALDIWLEQDPERGITRAVELWNDASAKERALGYEGMQLDDLVEEAGWVPLGNNRAGAPPGILERLQELEA